MSLKLKARDVFVNAKAVEKLDRNRRVWSNLNALFYLLVWFFFLYFCNFRKYDFFKTTRDMLFQSYDQRLFSVDELSLLFWWKRTWLEIQNLITVVLSWPATWTIPNTKQTSLVSVTWGSASSDSLILICFIFIIIIFLHDTSLATRSTKENYVFRTMELYISLSS